MNRISFNSTLEINVSSKGLNKFPGVLFNALDARFYYYTPFLNQFSLVYYLDLFCKFAFLSFGWMSSTRELIAIFKVKMSEIVMNKSEGMLFMKLVRLYFDKRDFDGKLLLLITYAVRVLVVEILKFFFVSFISLYIIYQRPRGL